MAAWLVEALKELDRIGALKANWDTYGSPPMSREIILKANDLLRILAEGDTPTPTLTPMSGGFLQIEWDSDGATVELTICP